MDKFSRSMPNKLIHPYFFVKQRCFELLTIINAYQIKTGLSRTKISHLINSETWMNALEAKELDFCD